MEHYDVIIIGTGAGGGTLAHRLAPTGKRILLLERGGYLPREPENWDSEEVFRKERYLSGEEWIDKDGNAFRPHQQYFVGGNTKFYGAILFRLRERDFGEVRHHAGVSPAWPLTYDDLEPYYAEAERLYLVHGERGEDPTEAPASGPFPYPAVSHEPRIQQLHDDFVQDRPSPVPPAGRRRPRRDRPRGRALRALRPLRRLPVPDRRQGRRARPAACARRSSTRTSRCARHARVDAPGDRRAAGASVTEVVVDRRGRRGALQRRRRRRLLRRGRTRRRCCCARPPTRHPRGLANSSDVVGRHYMAHINSGVIAISQTPNTTQFQKTLGVNDYYWGADDFDFPLGHIQMLGKSDKQHPARRRAVVRPGPGAGLHGQARDRLLADHRGPAAPRQPRHRRPRRAGSTWPRSTTTPSPTAGCWPSSRACSARSAATRRSIPSWSVLDQRIPLAGVAHQCGTVRFGTRSGDVGPRRRLQGPRPRQPLRRRHELLPVVAAR